MSDDDAGHFEINASIEDVDLCVSGEDPEWVEEQFDEKMRQLATAAERLHEIFTDDHEHVAAAAGWMHAEVSGDTTEEAIEAWREVWSEMLDDVSDLSEAERAQAGLRQ